MIKDRFNRVHDYLRISLTDKCNLNCIYCLPDSDVRFMHNSKLMKTEEIIDIAETFVSMGVKKIRLTGGEPLIRKDFGEILEGLARLKTELTLTTNAVYVDRYIDAFKRAGVRSVNVSLDTLDENNFRLLTKHNNFTTVMENINLLMKEGFHTKINVVLMKGSNDNEIRDFVRWTMNEALHVRFIEFMPFQGNKWDRSKTVSYKEILSEIHTEFTTEKLKDGPHDTTRKFRIEGAKGTFAVISTVTKPFCTGCNRIRLTADGKIRNCLFSNSETDILGAYRKGEDFKAIIHKAMEGKHLYHAGLPSFDRQEAREVYDQGRTMTAIGG